MSVFTKIRNKIEASLDNEIAKSERRSLGQNVAAIRNGEPLEKRAYSDETRGRKGLIIDPFFGSQMSTGMFRNKKGSLSNQLLKLAARQNICVSTIIHTRAGQVAAACRKQETRFDFGFKFVPTHPGIDVVPEEVDIMSDYITNCGNKENRNEQDKMTFDQFGYAITVDALRYGYWAVERDWLMDGSLNCWLPLSAESIYYAANNVPDKQLRAEAQSWGLSIEAQDRDFEATDPGDEDQENPVEYVQIIHGRDVANFTHKELIFAKLTPDADIDLNGYAISPTERAITMIGNQLKIENHQAQFFTHGIASRGVLVIQGDITQRQVDAISAQWTAQVSGASNAWRTPILGGVKGVQWVPLSMSNRDMEFAAYQDHVLRSIHAAFAIDPEETGYGYLSRGTESRTMGEANNEWKITNSRDKGLRPILARIEAMINEEILPYWNPELSQKYRFVFAGLDAETRMEENERLSSEVQLHTTVNEIRKETGKELFPVGGNLILNPLLIQTLMQAMPFGMFVEFFMGLKGASKDPGLQFYANPFYFQNQQFQMQVAMMEQGLGPDGQPPKEEKTEKSESDWYRTSVRAAAEQLMKSNPAFRDWYENDLRKSRAVHKKLTGLDKHSVTQYREASNRMIQEILKAVQNEVIDAENKLRDAKAAVKDAEDRKRP